MTEETKPRKRKTSPSERSLEWLRDRGYICQVTEQTIRYPSKKRPGAWEIFKRDLFNICDIIAVHPSHSGTMYLQVTGGMNNKGERQQKIETAPATLPIIRAGNLVELHVWRKVKPRGVKVGTWKVARFQIRAEGTVERPRWVWDQVFEDGETVVDARRETPSLFETEEVF